MTETPQAFPDPGIDTAELLRSLRQKEGSWVEWGQACQQLQKAGYSPQAIFEETGFEPIQQNQIIVAAQVYTALVAGNAPTHVLNHFQLKGSDSLYELRILTQPQRVATAELLLDKQIDSEGAHGIAKAVKEFSMLARSPEGFTTHPGDAVAYQCWKSGREKTDLQERSRLIARGLSFAYSETARQKIESLLTDFTVVKARPTPRLPIYRLDSEEELPRVLPIVGKLPLAKADLQAVPLLNEVGPFRMVQFSGQGAWVPVPGWQIVLRAEDPVVLLSHSDQLPVALPGKPEEVLVVVDRAERHWDDSSYFVVEQAGQLQLQWFEAAPEVPLLGRVILVMRPKKILDEEVNRELWQMDE